MAGFGISVRGEGVDGVRVLVCGVLRLREVVGADVGLLCGSGGVRIFSARVVRRGWYGVVGSEVGVVRSRIRWVI